MQISVLDYLEKAKQEYPARTAYLDEKNEKTFQAVYEEARRIGSYLCRFTKPKSPIIIISQKSVVTPILQLSAVYAGCYYVPLAADLPTYRLNVILDIVKADIILTDGENEGVIQKLNFQGSVLQYADAVKENPWEEELSARRAQMLDVDPLYVIFTSGSSGKPKGVIAPHRAVIDYIDVFASTFQIKENDIFGNQAPLDYIAAIRDIYLPLHTGACTVMIPARLFSAPQQLFEYLNAHRITTLCWVASALVLCAELHVFDSIPLETVQKVFFTGSVMPCKHLRVWQTHLDALYVNHYGPTEITASCTYYMVDKLVEDNDVLPIGTPFRNTEILLLDEKNRPVPNGTMGEICVRGTCLALGYYGDPVKTDESFVPYHNGVYEERIYKTGDLGILREDQNLSFHGRKDSQIKHMGHRIELSEIEMVTGSLPPVQNCCCLYQEASSQIYLFYTGETDNKELAVFLRARLPKYMLPRKFIQLAEMPKMFNGKIDLAELRRIMDER